MTRIVRGKPTQFDYNDNRVKEVYCFPYQAVPIVIKKLLLLTYKGMWPNGQHVDGRDMIVRCMVSIFGKCNNETAEAVRDVYRLIAHTVNGTLYTISGSGGSNDPEQILPAIPRIPADFNGSYGDSLIAQIKQLQGAVRNGDDGIPYGPYPEATGKRQLLEAIRNLLENQSNEPTLDDEMLAELVKIVGLLA